MQHATAGYDGRMDTCCIGPFWGLATISLARVILSPMFEKHTSLKATAQFHVMDLASLVWLLSLALGAATFPERQDYWGYPGPDYPDNSGYRILLMSAVLLAVCLWWIGVGTLNRLGVTSPILRTLFPTLVVPLVYLSSALVCSLLPIWAFSYPNSRATGRTVALAYAALSIILFGCYWFARYVRSTPSGMKVASNGR